jgi:uncharacterized membrane protein YfcA
MNWALSAAGFGVGIIVGLTGMGGGALMTPVLVIFFGIPPLAAVSNDLVASAIMKPVGSFVHIRRGRVDWRLVGWLCAGSVPFAFAGVLVAKAIGHGAEVQTVVKTALGIALLLAVAGLVLRSFLRMRDHAGRRAGTRPVDPWHVGADGVARVTVRPLPTALLGAAGGLVVGMTSVGSGSLIIVALLALYPMLRANDLVGTDLAQAVPLVAAAALGHLLYGDFTFSVTGAIVIGSIPGVYLGARISSRAPGGLVRRALAIVLLASALNLLQASKIQLIVGVAIALVVSPLAWAAARRHYGLPLTARGERLAAAAVPAQASTHPADAAYPADGVGTPDLAVAEQAGSATTDRAAIYP